MNTSWIKPNLFVVQNGKLVPRRSTPEQKKNYRYIPYQPMNNPTPEDYFRETISRLQKENTALKNQLSSRLREEDERSRVMDKTEEARQYEAHISMLMRQLAIKNQELEQRNILLTNKDKRVLELSNQNTKLHLRINNVVKEIEALNFAMSKKDEELYNTKEELSEYCRVLDRLTQKEKEEERTMASEKYLSTPKIQEKIGEEDEDEFYSMQCDSYNGRNSIDFRFMTPNIRPIQQGQHLYRSHHQPPDDQNITPRKPTNKRIGSEQSYFSFNNIPEFGLQELMRSSMCLQVLNEDMGVGSLSRGVSIRK